MTILFIILFAVIGGLITWIAFFSEGDEEWIYYVGITLSAVGVIIGLLESFGVFDKTIG